MPSLLGVLALAAVSTVVVWAGSMLLERASRNLAAYFGVPAVVEGAVIIAIGSSFPELSSTLLATLLHGEFDLGVGVIVGSAIFNILVIPAASQLFSDHGLRSNRDLVFKESLFYMLSISVLVITFALAVLYHPTDEGRLVGEITRPLALIPLGLYALYLFIQSIDVAEHDADRDRTINPWLETGLLILSLILIVASVEGLVRAAIDLGAILNTPSYIWGLTIIAAATSLPDAFVSIRSAQRRHGIESIANVLGSNVFDLCIAIPLGVLIAGATAVNFAAAVPMFGILTLATIVLFTFLRTQLELARWEAIGLLILYAGFVGFTLETGGVIDLIAGL